MKIIFAIFVFVTFIFVSILADDYDDITNDGGWVSISVDNPDMLKALKAVSRELYSRIINAEENKNFILFFGKVLTASEQVVAGMNFNVTFTLDKLPNCFGIHCEPSQQLFCEVYIYKDLKNSYNVTKFNWI